MRRLILLLVVSLLGGCATPIPFNTIKHNAKQSIVSNKEAALLHVSGAVRGSDSTTMIPAGNIFIPVSSGPVPELQFHKQDQADFIKVLRSELLRLKVFKAVSINKTKKTDIKITIIFAQTYHHINNQEYTLDVVMNLEGGKNKELKEYRINSNEGASILEKWNTNAYEGKAKAVRKLLNKLIPDIQKYVAGNT